MKKKYELELEIPEGVDCSYADGILECKKGEKSFSKEANLLDSKISVAEGKIKMTCKKANRKNIKFMVSFSSHIKNGFKGLEEDFVYKLEICHVHFPMTVKVEGDNLVITNFLGEKEQRNAKILSGVNVDVKGKDVTVSGHDIEKTGQTAANIESATKVKSKDRRIFQDGIFITEKPRGAI